jgi:hypothetical protein
MNKKVILTYYDVNNDLAEETLWIEQLTDGQYQVKNIPFFAPNIAYNDIISIEEEEGCMYFDDIIKTSEHSTIQIVFFRKEAIEQTIKDIESLKCSWEGMHEQQIIAVDLPSDINYKKVKEYLNTQCDNGILDYKEACLSETHAKQISE